MNDDMQDDALFAAADLKAILVALAVLFAGVFAGYEYFIGTLL